MKRILSLLLTCALGLSLLSGCAGSGVSPICDGFPDPPPSEPFAHLVSQAFLPAASPQVEAALADFGLELLKQARGVSAEKAMASEVDHVPFSTLVSPFSVAMALSMAANGAERDTLLQFQEVLGGGADLEEINAAWAQLTGDYHALGGSTKCSIANSLWVDLEGGIYEDFAAKCQGGYGAELYRANLSVPRIVDDVNAWVSDHTGKLIPEIINEPFDKDTALLLVNALYLKNKWRDEFSPYATHEREFHHAGGPDSRVDFLSKHDTQLPYLSGNGAQGVVLPYDDGRLAFFALLPDVNTDAGYLSFGDWLNTLEGNDLAQLINSREDALFLSFAMPKFEAEWKGNLEKILPLLGLDNAFLPGVADFSKMGDNPDGYFISQVVHAAKIEVNEKGTEAAAATVVAANGGSAAPPPEGVTLILDRPFLYGIVDLQTNVPLFLGTYE